MPTTYSVTVLPNPTAQLQIGSLYDLNDAGNVAGGYLDYAHGVAGGLILDGAAYNTYSTFVYPDSSYQSWATLINDSNEVVGRYTDGVNFLGNFLYNGASSILISDPAAGSFGASSGTLTSATGINDSGDVVGSYSDYIAGQGFIYSNGHYGTLINPLSTGFYRGTSVAGINNAGDIVGAYTEGDNHSNGVHATHAFIFTGGTWVQTLASDNSWNAGLTDAWSPDTTYAAGSIVTYSDGGTAYTYMSLADGNADDEPWFNTVSSVHNGIDSSVWRVLGVTGPWSYLGNFTTLTYPGSGGTEAIAINNADEVLGYYIGSNSTKNYFLYDSGAYTIINDPAAKAGTTVAVGLNDSGDVAGYYNDSSNNTHSFVYHNGIYTDIELPSGLAFDYGAIGINNAGQVLGQSTGGYYIATPDINSLFDDQADLVDFNILLVGQKSAINGGANLYDAMAGNDDVALPDPAHFSLTDLATWDPAQTFFGGAGDDLIDLSHLGGYSSGATLQIDGDGPAVTTSGQDTVELPGSPADYEFDVNFNQNNLSAGEPTLFWRNTATTITTTGAGGLPTDIDVITTDVEKVKFATKIDNVVTLTDNSVAIEMLQLAAESYGPDTRDFFSHDPLAWEDPDGRNTGAKASESAADRNWHPVAAIELGMMPADYGSGSVLYSFVGGQYQGFSNQGLSSLTGGEADALVLTGVVNGVRTLAIAIRGTDQAADIPDYATGFSSYFQKFQPLAQALHDYVSDPANGIGQVLISGHSLGAGAVPYFLNVFNDVTGVTTTGYTDGFPNSAGSYGGTHLENFIHSGALFGASVDDHIGDPVPSLGAAWPLNHPSGTYINIDSDVPQGGFVLNGADFTAGLAAGFQDNAFFGPQHNENLYELDLARILQFARDPDSPLYGTPFALSLINNTTYQSSVSIAVGQPREATLEDLMNQNFISLDAASFDPNDLIYQPDVHVYARDSYVLGTTDGTIIWDRPTSQDTLHIVDGAGGSTVLLPYAGAYVTTNNGDETDLLLQGGQLLGHLNRVKSIMIGDAGTVNGQLFINVDGSAPHVQTTSAASNHAFALTSGAGTFIVDHSYDYSDVGDSDLTVTGTDLGDIIYVGSGNDTINEGSGSDIVVVKDQATAGNLIVHGGAGNDIIASGAGNDQLFGDAGQDSLHGNGGHDVLHGGADADTFFLDTLGSGAVTEIADYDQGNNGTYASSEADVFDLTGLFGAPALQADPSGLTLVRLVDNPSNAHVLLQVDTDGTANGIAWATVAQLDGLHGSDAVTAVLDDTQSLGLSLSVFSDAGHFGDFDGVGGQADLLWRNDAGTVATWQMNGGTIASGNFITTVGPDWHILGTGDFNGDHKTDILWQNDDGSLLDWQMASSSAIDSAFGIGTAPANSVLAGIGDVDGDHKDDLLWRDLTTGAVTVHTQAGATTTISGVGNDWSVVGVGDYNGDGIADVMFRNESQGVNAAWLMNGTSTPTTVFYPGVPNDWHVEATGDFNGDGVADLFWHNDNGANAVWLMDHSGAIQSTGFFDGVGPDWHVVGSGDFNGDNKDDLVWRNDNGGTAIWQMDGANTPTVTFPGGVPNDWATQAHHYDYV